jgi:exo-1,4-beta-D-glucosaminidase
MARDNTLGSVFFVRLQLKDAAGSVLAENVYWASNTDDVVGNPNDPSQFKTELEQWADFSALSDMPAVRVQLAAKVEGVDAMKTATLTLKNLSNHIAFFLRAEVTAGPDGEEILPITYDDNYVTLFPQQTKTLVARFEQPASMKQNYAVRLEGYNVGKMVLPLK